MVDRASRKTYKTIKSSFYKGLLIGLHQQKYTEKIKVIKLAKINK